MPRCTTLGPMLLALGLLLGGSKLSAAELTLRIEGGDAVTFVGAFQRWDPDGNLTKPVNPKARIDQPEVDAVAKKADDGRWVFKDLKPGKYDLVLMTGERVRIEGWEFAPVLEFDPFLPPTATVEDQETREFIVNDIKGSRHYENKVVPLYLGGNNKVVRILMMLIRDKRTSYEGHLKGAATMRFEIWEYTFKYGGWVKQRRTRVMHRVLLTRDELRRWTWLWDARLGAIQVGADDATIEYRFPPLDDPHLKGLRPY